MNVNQVNIAGRLTRDVELKYTPSNMAVATVGLAVNHKYKTKDGEKKEEVTFIDCELWGKTAELASQYLKKGEAVFFVGRLKLDQWQDKDGGNRSKLKVVVDQMHFIGGGKKSDSQPVAAGAQTAPAPFDPDDDPPY